MKPATVLAWTAAVIITVLIVVVPDWHRPGYRGTQMGFRASQMVQFESRAERMPVNLVPPSLPPAAVTA